MKLKELWARQWFKNLVFFVGLAVIFFTPLPQWVNIQITKFGLESPEHIEKTGPLSGTMYRYQIGLESVEGEERSLSSYQGKFVFVNLWASWCVPCLAEFPSLVELQEKMPEMQFVFINLEDKAAFEKYMKRTSFELPFYRLTTPMPKELTAQAIPASFILDPEGRIVYRHYGASNWSDGMTVHQLQKLLD